MKLLFKQRFFSWFDSYDIYGEAGETIYTVKGQPSWTHCLKIYDPHGRELGAVKEQLLTFLPKFDLYLGQTLLGSVRKEMTLFTPKFTVDCNGWQVEGNWLEWNYRIVDASGAPIAQIQKELWNWTDTYTVTVPDPKNALCALMLVLAIDAEKCSRRD